MSTFATPNLADRVERTLRDNEAALRSTRENAAERRVRVERSRVVVGRALGRLRRAGLVKP